MFKNISTKGLNIGQVLLLTFFYMLLKLLLVIGLSEVLVHFIENISLEIEFGEFLSAAITLILFIFIFKNTLKTNKQNYLPFPKVKLFCLIIIAVIGFRLLEDPFFRYENIFFEKPLFDASKLKAINFSAALMFKFIYIVFLLPIFEELFFRRIIFKSLLKKYSSFWLAILVSSILFSLIHLSFTSILPKLIFGIIAAYIYYKTNNIWYSITFHILSNFLWFLTFIISPKHYWILLEKFNFGIGYWLLVISGTGLILLVKAQFQKLRLD